MTRLLFLSCALVCLALLVVYAIADLTRSIGASAVALSPVSALWDVIAPQSRDVFGRWLADRVHPFAADPILTGFADWPVVLVLAVLACVFALLGGKRRKRSHLFDGTFGR